MPAPPTVPASQPTVVPARPEAVFDRWVLAGLTIDGTNVGTDTAHGSATFRKARVLLDDQVELEPSGEMALLTINNLTELAMQFTSVRAALDAVVAALVEVATAQGLL